MQSAQSARKLTKNRRPNFDSVDEFVRFCQILSDQWRRPAPPSSFERNATTIQLGCRIDVSPAPVHHHEPSEIYHVGWVGQLLRDVRRRITADHWEAWTLVAWETPQSTQRDVAERHDISQQMVSQRLATVREVVRDELETRGMM